MPLKTSLDGFLDNRLKIAQPIRGWRAGLDAVLLAAAVPAHRAMHCCEFGTGVGIAALCLAYRTCAHVWAVEKHAAYARLAQQNAQTNRLKTRLHVIHADIEAPDCLRQLRQKKFSHVFFNPPYYHRSDIRTPPHSARRMALTGSKHQLHAWLRRAASLLKPKGHITLIHRADALDLVLPMLGHAFADICIKPVQPYPYKASHRVILQAQLGGHAPVRLLAPLILYDAPGKPNPHADTILRDGQELALSS